MKSSSENHRSYTLRLGTRGSALALAQTHIFCDELKGKHAGLEIEIVQITTTGDSKQGSEAESDKRDWIHELELAVVRGDIDLAIHSGKDIPCEIDASTELLPMLKRENPCDFFIGRKSEDGNRIKFKELSERSRIGTGSLRRTAQLYRLRNDLIIEPFGGNITTRVRKLDEENQFDGIVLAAAGINRLNELDVQGELFSTDELLPAVNQGTLVAQFGTENSKVKEYLSPLVDSDTEASFLAERGAVVVLDGDCKSAIGVFAEVKGDELYIRSEVYSHDGSETLRSEAFGSTGDAYQLGERVGEELLAKGAKDLL